MKIRCPYCPSIVLEFDWPIPEIGLQTLRCSSCRTYVTQFADHLGVTYASHSLARIQELHEETKEARKRIYPRPNSSNKRRKKGKDVESGATDSFS